MLFSDLEADPFDSTEVLMDQLMAQAYQKASDHALKTAMTPVQAPRTNGAQKGRTSILGAGLVEASGNGELQGTAADPTSPQSDLGRRVSKAERMAMESEAYNQQKQAANTDILGKALLGAGVLGLGALAGRKGLSRGAQIAKEYHLENEVAQDFSKERDYLKRRSSIADPAFWAAQIQDPIAKETQQGRLKELYRDPMKVLGAAGYRLGLDVASDGTRSLYWRYNHPLAITTSAINKAIDPVGALSAADKAAIAFAVSVPAVAAAGAYDPTNPSELFRPAGYKQNLPVSEDPRQSSEPATELLQRFFMGRTGRPLAYEEAKKDIPDLTPERYGNYLRFTYQDKGIGGLGIIKATDENLQGVPEARMLGYPVTIPMATIAALGAAGSGLATGLSEDMYRSKAMREVENLMDVKTDPSGGRTYIEYEPEILTKPTGESKVTGRRVPKSERTFVRTEAELPDPRSRQTIESYLGEKPMPLRRQQRALALAGVGAGAVTGHFLGNFINQMLASSKNNPKEIPTTQEYGVS